MSPMSEFAAREQELLQRIGVLEKERERLRKYSLKLRTERDALFWPDQENRRLAGELQASTQANSELMEDRAELRKEIDWLARQYEVLTGCAYFSGKVQQMVYGDVLPVRKSQMSLAEIAAINARQPVCECVKCLAARAEAKGESQP